MKCRHCGTKTNMILHLGICFNCQEIIENQDTRIKELELAMQWAVDNNGTKEDSEGCWHETDLSIKFKRLLK